VIRSGSWLLALKVAVIIEIAGWALFKTTVELVRGFVSIGIANAFPGVPMLQTKRLSIPDSLASYAVREEVFSHALSSRCYPLQPCPLDNRFLK